MITDDGFVSPWSLVHFYLLGVCALRRQLTPTATALEIGRNRTDTVDDFPRTRAPQPSHAPCARALGPPHRRVLRLQRFLLRADSPSFTLPHNFSHIMQSAG